MKHKIGWFFAVVGMVNISAVGLEVSRGLWAGAVVNGVIGVVCLILAFSKGQNKDMADR